MDDPYRVLGVVRTASRDTIAHAYRLLAKAHHPDSGAAPSPEMSRINEAWHILSDPMRRARWDREHTIVEPMLPTPRPAATLPRPEAASVPPSRLDSAWVAAGIVALTAVAVAAIMVGVSIAAQPGADGERLETDELTLLHPSDWTRSVGDGQDAPEQRLLAHIATWPADAGRLCTTYGEACGIEAGMIPPGEGLILITSHASGTPPVPEPVRQLPGGADADAIIGGEPAVHTRTDVADGLTLDWWQLSPPGFPDRWIEVRVLTRGFAGPLTGTLDEVEEMLATVDFRD